MLHMYSFLRGFLIPSEEKVENKKFTFSPYVMTLQSELMKLGYIMSPDLMTSLTDEKAIEIYKSIIANIKFLIGDDGNYMPFYKNFPESVIEKSHLELLLDQCMSYFMINLGEDGSSFVPVEAPKKIDDTNMEVVKYKVIRRGNLDMLHKSFLNLVSCNNSITSQDKLFIQWYVGYMKGDVQVTVEVPFKETLCYLVSLGVTDINIKTPTDVLRIAEYLSLNIKPDSFVADTSEIANVMNEMSKVKFRKFTRPERRMLLNLLEHTSCSIDDMYSDRMRWIRLGEILHPRQYTDRYPRAAMAFYTLRNDKNINTWNKSVLEALKECYTAFEFTDTARDLLVQRPGEFARRLDAILRKLYLVTDTTATDAVLDAFISVAHKVSNKVILELYNHMSRRKTEFARTLVLNKRKYNLPTLHPMPKRLVNKVLEALKTALAYSFEQSTNGERLYGFYFLDKTLKNLPIATGMRDAADGLVIYPKYTKLPIGEGGKKRFYIHWKDEYGNKDIDLSALCFNDPVYGRKNTSERSLISWNGWYKDGISIVHSGDVRHQRGDCAEYIDVDTNLIRSHYRYIAIFANNFNGGENGFLGLSARMGWSDKTSFTNSRVWKPETVEHSFLINSNTNMSIVSVIDTYENCIYVLNESAGGDRYADIQLDMSEFISKTSEKSDLITMHDILAMRIKAHGGTYTDDLELYTSITEKVLDVDTAIKHGEFTFDELSKDYAKAQTYLL